tara:strand:+ start:867 stop:1058 length:192 start_codon:yes stop_codon:yes gene_type:complete
VKIRIAEVGLNNNFTPAGYIDNDDDPETETRAVVARPKIYTEKKQTSKKIKIKILPKDNLSCV